MWTLRGLSVDPAKAQTEKSAKCEEPTSWMVSGTHHHNRTNFCFLLLLLDCPKAVQTRHNIYPVLFLNNIYIINVKFES